MLPASQAHRPASGSRQEEDAGVVGSRLVDPPVRTLDDPVGVGGHHLASSPSTLRHSNAALAAATRCIGTSR